MVHRIEEAAEAVEPSGPATKEREREDDDSLSAKEQHFQKSREEEEDVAVL